MSGSEFDECQPYVPIDIYENARRRVETGICPRCREPLGQGTTWERFCQRCGLSWNVHEHVVLGETVEFPPVGEFGRQVTRTVVKVQYDRLKMPSPLPRTHIRKRIDYS